MNIKNKLSSLMYAPLALALLAACSSDDVVENNQPTTQGQTLTINATTGSEDGTRVDFGNDGNGKYATSWQKTDQVRIYAGNNTNVGTFNVTGDFTAHNAKFTGKLTTTLTKETPITGYIINGDVVKTSTNGVVAEDGFGKQIEVDYSEQDGTWDDAVSRCVLFGKGTYYPSNADQPVDMKFEYKTTFFKLVLNFGDNTLNTTASMCLTGDNVISNSRINATGSTAGEQDYAKDLFISINNVTITNGTATVYVALYPQALTNVSLQAVLVNNDVYDFNISNGKTAIPEAGKVYTMKRNGEKQGVSTSWEGKGTEKNPFLINSVADLKLLAYNVNNIVDAAENKDNRNTGYNGKYFKLTSDIIINGEWEPIGNSGHPFRGMFDGYDDANKKNHTISGNISVSNLVAKNGAGLFGFVGVNGIIKNLTSKLNLTVTNGGVEGYTGAFVGRITDKVTLQNCVNLGSVTSETNCVGGLVGHVHLQNTSNSYECLIEACYNKGNVTCTRTVDATTSIGGIIGLVNGNKTGLPNLKVTGCYTDGTIFASGVTKSRYFGGIIGNVTNPVNIGQAVVQACWVSNLTFPNGGNRGYFVGAPTKVPFTLTKCWYEITDTKAKPIYSTEATAEYKSSKDTELSGYISEMNTAWGSSTYEFNTDGTIKTK